MSLHKGGIERVVLLCGHLGILMDSSEDGICLPIFGVCDSLDLGYPPKTHI